ncbi:MAG: SurA N-terminal domain-containing protein [Gammaproteobacteria bacterium]
MLQSIRDRAQGLFAWIILILICIPFVFWGIQNYMVGGREQAVAVVGDKEIFQAELSRAYQQMAARLGSIGQIDEETLQKLALKNLIDQEVLLQTARGRGFVVSDAQIRDVIRQIPYFQGQHGFDKEKYDTVLRVQRITEPYFVEQMRNEMEIAQLQEGITRSTFATKSELERFLILRDQLRKFEYLTIPVQESDAAIKPEEIEAYYKQNEASFRYPEKVSVQYIELNIDEIAAKFTVTEEELRNFYESQKELYTRKERRKVSHILAAVDPKGGDASDAAALEKIHKARAMLNDGEEFATVAQKLSDDKITAKQGGDIGLINPGDLDKNFEEAALALDLGQVSDVVKTPFGYHLIKLTELEAGEVKPFETVKAEVETAYRRQKAENTFYEVGERLAQITYENPDNLLAAAENAGLEIKTSELFSRGETKGFGANPKIQEAAFSEQVLEGKNSDPVELGSDRVMFLRLDKHIPASSKPLEDVRDEIVSLIKNRNARDAAKKEADTLFKELQAGTTTLAAVGESKGLKVSKPEAVPRNETTLPQELVKALFSADKPVKDKAVPFQVGLADGAQVLAELLEVQNKPASETGDQEKQKDQADKWLSTQIANAEFSDLLGELKEETGITVFEKDK